MLPSIHPLSIQSPLNLLLISRRITSYKSQINPRSFNQSLYFNPLAHTYKSLYPNPIRSNPLPYRHPLNGILIYSPIAKTKSRSKFKSMAAVRWVWVNLLWMKRRRLNQVFVVVLRKLRKLRLEKRWVNQIIVVSWRRWWMGWGGEKVSDIG